MVHRWSLERLALWAAFLPTLTVHLCWVTAASTGALEWCNPYWSHCHSISATGREAPQFYFFKALMLPSAAVMLIYWRKLRRQLPSRYPIPPSSLKRIEVLGIFATLSLIVYTLTLGLLDETFVVPRRMGVIGYFAFTAFAHLLLLASLKPLLTPGSRGYGAYLLLFWLCLLLVALGTISAMLGFFWRDYSHWDNAFEWWFAILMVSQFVAVARVARTSNKST